MLVIRERNGKFLNFFSPSLVVLVGGMLLSFLNLLVSFIISFIGPFSQWDSIIVNLLILLMSQVFGIFFVYLLFIPLFKARNIERHHLNFLNSIRTVVLTCVTFTLIFISNFILVNIFKVFNAIPKSGYKIILLNSSHLNNPLNIMLFYLPLTIGAPIYEELLYRRLLIPLLEKRGMSSLIAVITSSFIFAIAHLPSDLVNGNVPGGIIHVWSVFLIGVSLGLIYVLTRNIFYPIIIHGVLNFISFASPIILLLENDSLIIGYNIIVFIIFFVGLGAFLFILWQYLKRRDAEWVVLIRKKPFSHIKLGILSFLIIGVISAFLPLGIHFLLLNLAVYDVLLYFMVSIGSFGILIVVFSWLGTITTYNTNKNQQFKQKIKSIKIKKEVL